MMLCFRRYLRPRALDGAPLRASVQPGLCLPDCCGSQPAPLLPVVRRGPRVPSERVKSSVLEQCRSRKPQVADSVVARLFALAMLELIFLLLCSDMLQRLFLICCIVPTPGTKLCCQCRQRGVGLACS